MQIRLGLLAVLLTVCGLAGAQTAPTNFNLSTNEAAATDIDDTPGYGANYGTGSSYDLRFGRINATTAAQTPIVQSFEVGPDLFIQVPRAVPTPYDRVNVNRRVTSTVDNMNKFTGFFSNNGLAGGIADGSTVFFQSNFIATFEGIINSYDIDRGADNVFANAASVATRNNVQRIDKIIDDPLIVGADALARTGLLILERGGNDQLTLAAITSLDPVTGEVTGLGPLIKTAGPLGATWGSTGVSRATTVFQNDNSPTGFQDIRPDQNISSQSISGSFISLADLGISAGQPMYGVALFGNDVVDTMDLIGLSDVPLDTDGTAEGGLDLMGGGGFFFSSQLELDKQADVATYAAAGDEIEYSFVLTNNGAVPLTDAQVDDPMLGGVIPCVPSTLPPGESADCGPVIYTVTQADIDAGQIVNVAQGTALDPDDEPLFAIDNEIVTGPPRVPGLEVEKLLTDAPSPVFAGDLLEFTISATNIGNITLSNVVVVDPLLTPDTITCPSVAPQDSCDLVGTYQLTQADIDAGTFTNLGSAEAPNPLDPDGPGLEDEDELITPLPAAPDLILDKLITAGDPYAQVGDLIDYQLTATNTGNVTLSNVTISDPDIAALSCTPAQPAVLAPTESLVCTGSYAVVQGDIDQGSFTNLASVSGEGPGGEPASDTDDATADGPPADPALAVTKVLTDFPDPIVLNSVLEYTVTATNTGNVTLSDVLVLDPLLSPDNITCPTLAPTETCVLVGNYTVTQEDIDAGQIVNIGSAEAPDPRDPDGPPLVDDEEVITPLPQAPGLTLDKIITAGDPYAQIGDVISYQLTATNTGDVTLIDVQISDPLIPVLSCTPTQPATLSPGQTLVCTGSYTVDQDEIDAGSFSNTALANGEAPDGTPVSDEDTAVATGPAANPALAIEKALTDAPDPIVDGSVLTYTVTATNTGNVTLNSVVVTDTLIDPSSITCPTLAPTQTCVLTGTYTVDQDDIDAGQIINTGTADSDETGPEDDTVTTPLDQNPALAIVKALTNAPDPIVDGSVLTYTVTSTNTGDITLNNVVVSDTLIDPSSITCPTVAVGDTCVLTGTYTVNEDDVDAGEIVNTGSALSDETPDPIEDTVTTPVPSVELGLITEQCISDVPYVSYELEINGITDPEVTIRWIAIEDGSNAVIEELTLQDESGQLLWPGAAVDLDGNGTAWPGWEFDPVAGWVQVPSNLRPTMLLEFEINPTVSAVVEYPPATPECSASPQLEPGLEIEKELTDAPDPIVVGSELTYTITATNNGNVTLTDVVVSDNLINPSTITCASVAIGETCVLTGTYTVDQADVDAGEILNTASAVSEETPDPVEDELTTPVPQNPAIELDKVITDGNPYAAVGDVIEYELTAINTGDVTLSEVTITDSGATIGSCTPAQPATLAPGESLVCSASYAVDQDNINEGSYINTATVTANDPNDDPISDTDTATADGPDSAAALGLVKTLQSPPALIVTGTELTYVITATNIGNVSLTDVLVEDDMITPDSISCSVVAPAETCVLVGTYVVQASDIDNGTLVNLATAVGTDPENEPVPEVTDTVTTLLTQPLAVPMTDRWALLLMTLLLLTAGLAAGSSRMLNRQG